MLPGAGRYSSPRRVPPSMPSRRAVLAAAVLGVGGLLADRVPIGDLEAWTPPRDTWPLARRGLANTGAAPDATVPDAPAVDWRLSLPDVRHRHDWLGALVVGPDRVYAATDELVAIDRDDGGEAWRRSEPAAELALRDGRLYVGHGPADVSAAGNELAAYDAATGRRAWHRSLPGLATGLAVVNGAVVVPCDYHTVAHEAGTGIRRWGSAALDCQQQPLVHRGALFMNEYGLTRYQARHALDIPLRAPPEPAWQADVGFQSSPVGVGNRVIVGSGLTLLHQEGGRPAVHAVDAASGGVEWSAVEADDRDVFLTADPVTADAGRDRVYVGLYRQSTGSDTTGEGYRSSVGAYALADGFRTWQVGVGRGRFVRDVVLAGDSVLVATARDDGVTAGSPGDVRALAAADGRERWRVGFDAPVLYLAPVDGTVFALTEAGAVAALR